MRWTNLCRFEDIGLRPGHESQTFNYLVVRPITDEARQILCAYLIQSIHGVTIKFDFSRRYRFS
jgi:hypothetical protein